jgi:methyl-accepting chemotaxis protein
MPRKRVTRGAMKRFMAKAKASIASGKQVKQASDFIKKHADDKDKTIHDLVSHLDEIANAMFTDALNDLDSVSRFYFPRLTLRPR